MPHETLGQVPFAIVESLATGVDKPNLEQVIIDKFGAECALGGVLTLDDLGMSTWPLNPTGKIMKITLKEAVQKRSKKSTA